MITSYESFLFLGEYGQPTLVKILTPAFSVDLLFHDFWIISIYNWIKEPAKLKIDGSFRGSYVTRITDVFRENPFCVQGYPNFTYVE